MMNYTSEKDNKQISYITVVFTTLFFSLVFLFIGFFLGKESIDEQLSSSNIEKASGVVNRNYSDKNVDFTLFWEVWDKLEERYVDHDELDSQKMMYGAIDGMLRSTGDPYTVFLDAEQMKSLEEELSGDFEGIGAEIGIKDDVLTIIAPLEDSPAMRSGLMAGDKIIKINGEDTTGISVYDAVKKIKGKKGTEVILNIYRNGEEDTRDISVIRDKINVKSVKLEFVDNVAHVKLMQFGDHTTAELQKAIHQIQKTEGVKGIVLKMG